MLNASGQAGLKWRANNRRPGSVLEPGNDSWINKSRIDKRNPAYEKTIPRIDTPFGSMH